jgi:large subunit ribosomal protein L9
MQKRGDAAGLKEKLESLALEITMPAGPNGKLYGAVTSQTIVDELGKQAYQLERKRIDIPGMSIKNVGKYKVTVKLYENTLAEISVSVLGQEMKTETKKAPVQKPFKKRRDNFSRNASGPDASSEEAQTTQTPETDPVQAENVSAENNTAESLPVDNKSAE